MKKDLKQVLIILIFLILGFEAGYLLEITQKNLLNDPSYIEIWTSNNMPVPETPGFAKSIVLCGLLFSGVPTGFIFYIGIANNFTSSIVTKIIFGFLTYPIYAIAGVLGSIPFVIYKLIIIFKSDN